MNLYIDTSVLVAFYCPEPLSEAAQDVLRNSTGPAVSALTSVEFHSAVAKKVRMGLMDEPEAHRVISIYHSHLSGGHYLRIAVTSEHYLLAQDRLASFTIPLHALDAIHLAVAISTNSVLVTADVALAKAMTAFGGETQLMSAR